MPCSDRRNCINNSGIRSSRWNLPRPPMRSAKLTSAHSMPMAASTQSKTGRKPAAVLNSRPSSSAFKAGRRTTSHSAIRMLVAVVDQGSDTATPTASQSAMSRKRARSKPGRSGRLVIRSATAGQDPTGLVDRAGDSRRFGGATHQAGGRMPGHELNQNNIAACAFDFLAADHVLDPVVGAFDQHWRGGRA